MVSSISYKLAQNKLITGFGTRRCSTRGRGIIRRTIGSIARPALGYIANKISDLIYGTGRRTVRRAGSWKPTGMGVRRKPRSTLKKRKTGGLKRKVTRRVPRSRLGGLRRKRVLY